MIKGRGVLYASEPAEIQIVTLSFNTSILYYLLVLFLVEQGVTYTYIIYSLMMDTITSQQELSHSRLIKDLQIMTPMPMVAGIYSDLSYSFNTAVKY